MKLLKHHNIKPHRNRGVAMLLVMLALVVCMVLVMGFLSGQGTSNGIARNEMEYVRAQRAAETGVNLCMSQIRNNSSWRSQMTPGTWLNKISIGSATVTVTVVDSAGLGSFLTTPTNAVVLTATGTYNGRTAQLVATAQPTGGGTVFYGGSFITGSIRLDTLALMDSFNSLSGAYTTLTAGANALIATAASTAGSVEVKDLAALNGSITAGVGATLNNILDLALGLLFGGSISAASEQRTSGDVIPINSAGLSTRSTTSYTGTVSGGIPSGVYSAMTVTQAGGTGTNISMPTTTMRVTGNFTMNPLAKMTINSNANVVIQVDGNLTWNGILNLNPGSSVTFIVGGTFTTTGASMNYNTTTGGGTPGNLTVMGLKSAGGFTLKSGTQFYGSLYAPSSDLVLQDTAQVYGGVVGKSLKITNSAKLHWDSALRTKTFNNLTNGSAPSGTPIYLMSYQWNPGSN